MEIEKREFTYLCMLCGAERISHKIEVSQQEPCQDCGFIGAALWIPPKKNGPWRSLNR